MKVLIVTPCGAKKNPEPMQAYRLYKSSRIKAVYNRRSGSDMCILSAEYGLVNAHETIKPYERVMDVRRTEELVPSVARKLKNYDCVIFFKGGAREVYLSCIKVACQKAGKTLVSLGYANMGGINDLPKVITFMKKKELKEIRKIKHAEVIKPSNLLHNSGKNLKSSWYNTICKIF